MLKKATVWILLAALAATGWTSWQQKRQIERLYAGYLDLLHIELNQSALHLEELHGDPESERFRRDAHTRLHSLFSTLASLNRQTSAPLSADASQYIWRLMIAAGTDGLPDEADSQRLRQAAQWLAEIRYPHRGGDGISLREFRETMGRIDDLFRSGS